MRTKSCNTCKGTVNEAFICRRCARLLRELLIGDGTVEPVVEEQHSKAQPGIVWYLDRLSETAYRQTVMDRNLGARSSSGYDQLGNHDAIQLLGKIHWTLTRWEDRLSGLKKDTRNESRHLRMVAAPAGFDGLDGYRAVRLADNVSTLRHKCEDIDVLLSDLLRYAKDAWQLINRPDDICCGPCPHLVPERDDAGVHTGREIPCGLMLYAEEFAEEVKCPKCRTVHSVSERREDLKQQARGYLFTGPELLKLMETRLNDRMPKSTFYQLIRDGRLKPRNWDDAGQPRYTYDDVCEARDKPKPVVRKKKSA